MIFRMKWFISRSLSSRVRLGNRFKVYKASLSVKRGIQTQVNCTFHNSAFIPKQKTLQLLQKSFHSWQFLIKYSLLNLFKNELFCGNTEWKKDTTLHSFQNKNPSTSPKRFPQLTVSHILLAFKPFKKWTFLWQHWMKKRHKKTKRREKTSKDVYFVCNGERDRERERKTDFWHFIGSYGFGAGIYLGKLHCKSCTSRSPFFCAVEGSSCCWTASDNSHKWMVVPEVQFCSSFGGLPTAWMGMKTQLAGRFSHTCHKIWIGGFWCGCCKKAHSATGQKLLESAWGLQRYHPLTVKEIPQTRQMTFANFFGLQAFFCGKTGAVSSSRGTSLSTRGSTSNGSSTLSCWNKDKN